MENLLPVLLKKIVNSYENNINSVCTFCGSPIKQIAWIAHYKTCISVAENHVKSINGDITNITKQITTTRSSNKKHITTNSKVINKPTVTKNKQQTTYISPTKSKSLVLRNTNEDYTDYDETDTDNEEEEEGKVILRIEAPPSFKSEIKRKREEQEQIELEEIRNKKSITNQIAIENQNKLLNKQKELCTIGNFSQCDPKNKRRKDIFDYIVIKINGSTKTSINVCQLNHFKSIYYCQTFKSKYLHLIESESNSIINSTCSSLYCTQKRINENKQFEFDCSKLISVTSKINNIKQYFCSLDCLFSICKDKNSPLRSNN